MLKRSRGYGIGFLWRGEARGESVLKKEERQREDHEAEPSFAGAVGESIGRPFPITVIILCH